MKEALVKFLVFCRRVADLMNTEEALALFSTLFGLRLVYLLYKLIKKAIMLNTENQP